MTDNDSLALRSLDDVERLARLAAGSGLTAFRRPEAAAVILLTGRELGLSPMASLRGIYEVSGRPVLAADLMVAIVRRSGLCASWRVTESTPERCTIETTRQGETAAERCTWTAEDARRAGCGGQTWQRFPRQMLAHRCATELARRVYPDVLLGLYTPEELGADVRSDGTPVAVVESPAPVVVRDVEPVTEVHPALAAFGAELEVLELPGEAVALWTKHRAAIAALPPADRESAWKALCKRTEDVGKMKNAKVWLKKAIAEADARRAEAASILEEERAAIVGETGEVTS
jgi:hypothetical protein